MSGVPKLRAGDLRSRIDVLRALEVSDHPGGGTLTGWTRVASPWAEVLGQNGREAIIAQSFQGVSYYRIRIRFRTGILTGDQIRFGTTDLIIRSATDPNGDREQLLILADTAGALPVDPATIQ